MMERLPPDLSCAPQRLPHRWQPVFCSASPVASVLMVQRREVAAHMGTLPAEQQSNLPPVCRRRWLHQSWAGAHTSTET